MRIAICDDCREDVVRLKNFLEKHQVTVYGDGEKLLEDASKKDKECDLYFLDIYMNQMKNGIALAKELRKIDEDAAICFVSSSNEFYREAYDLYDVNYLLKPVSEEAVSRLLTRVLRRQTRNRRQSFSFKWNGRPETIPHGNILYISSTAHNLNIYCKDGEVRMCKAKLDEVESLLDGSIFFRCHQSFLVNMYQVDNLSGSELTVGGHRIPVSRRYYTELKNRYQEILFEEVN